MEYKKLILGIDVDEYTTQAGYYDEKYNTVQSVNMANNTFAYSNPKSLSEIMTGDKDKGADLDTLTTLLKNVINESMRVTNAETLFRLCVTVPRFEIDILNAVRDSLLRLNIDEDCFQISSHNECFAYYAYSQKRDLYSSGVALFDYRENGISAKRLSVHKKDNQEYVVAEEEEYASDAVLSVVNSDNTLEQIENELCDITNSFFEKRVVSAVYLTGKGFDVEKLPPAFARLIITRRKAFVGQNLFAKGACFMALETVRPSVLDGKILLLPERITQGIEFDISDHGKPKRFRAIRAGVNWYMAERTVDFIIDDLRQIKINVETLDKKHYEHFVDISEIPFREGKTTRISIEIKFMAADRCFIRVRDKGFGQFVKSSGKVFYHEIDLSSDS